MSDAADQTTLRDGDSAEASFNVSVPALTLLFHPVAARIGERVRLLDLVGGGEVAVSRLTPPFAPPDARDSGGPIGDRVVSRSPLRLRRRGDAIELSGRDADARVDGQPLSGTVRVPLARLDDGVVIEMGLHVALLLHHVGPPVTAPPSYGLVGDSDRIGDVRRAIARVADLGVPVLLRGESGTGKELVARAIHAASPRRGGPMVSVNMAAVPAPTAASLLFGHVRGAFTGAVADHRGYFQQAEGGTLFLDEIGDVPVDVQAMLLRAVEQDEVQPLGTARATRIDVRLIAATDSDLEAGVGRGTFREALLHRLAGYGIALPPLRKRRDDIGRLLVHMLRRELAAVGEPDRLATSAAARSWLKAGVVAGLARAPWPGNVRQLANVARQIVISSRGLDRAVIDASVRRLFEDDTAEPVSSSSSPVVEPVARDVTPSPEQIRAALERHGYRMAAAAAELGVSRPRLYALAEGVVGVRTGRDLARGEIEAALAQHGGNLDEVAAALRVSRRSLTLRMRELGLERAPAP